MTEGHMKGGKFIPHNNSSDSGGVSSDQVDNNEPTETINQSDVEKLKNKKTN